MASIQKIEAQITLTDGRKTLWTFEPGEKPMDLAVETEYDDPPAEEILPNVMIQPPSTAKEHKIVVAPVGNYSWQRLVGVHWELVEDEEEQ